MLQYRILRQSGPRRATYTAAELGPTVHDTAPDASPWQAPYLRRRALAGSAGSFMVLLIVIEALFGVSQRNNGLATSTRGLHYL